MNMYLHELKSLRKSTIVWASSIIALAAIFFSVFPSMVNETESFKKLLSGYPAAVRSMLGINLDYITSILGFYSFIFSFIALCGAIQAMIIGTSVLSKESRERTADFLLVKPVSRFEIISAKLLAALTMILVTDIIFYTALTIMVNLVKTTDYDANLFFMINLVLFFIQVIFLAIGVVSSVFFNKLKSVLPISLGVVFGLYLIGALVTTGESDDAARFISPFKYFDITYIMKNASYETPYMIAAAVIVVVAVVTSYIIYTRKDIHAVS